MEGGDCDVHNRPLKKTNIGGFDMKYDHSRRLRQKTRLGNVVSRHTDVAEVVKDVMDRVSW